MQHVELHVLETSTDAYQAEQLAGLVTFNQEERCRSCDDRVAFDDDGAFIACSVLLTDEVQYLLCDLCTGPVLNPIERKNDDAARQIGG